MSRQLKTKKREIREYWADKMFECPGNSLTTLRRLYLPYPHQTITSAISRLMDAGMVYQSDTGDFYPVPAGYEERYRENRRQDRFRKWINLGRREGFFDHWMNEELARG